MDLAASLGGGIQSWGFSFWIKDKKKPATLLYQA